MNEQLLPTFRCPEDSLLPEDLIQEYINNGTNLRCPRGTQSERASECLGQCIINLANKKVITILNPVTDVIYKTSLERPELSQVGLDVLGSVAEKKRARGELRRL